MVVVTARPWLAASSPESDEEEHPRSRLEESRRRRSANLPEPHGLHPSCPTHPHEDDLARHFATRSLEVSLKSPFPERHQYQHKHIRTFSTDDQGRHVLDEVAIARAVRPLLGAPLR